MFHKGLLSLCYNDYAIMLLELLWLSSSTWQLRSQKFYMLISKILLTWKIFLREKKDLFNTFWTLESPKGIGIYPLIKYLVWSRDNPYKIHFPKNNKFFQQKILLNLSSQINIIKNLGEKSWNQILLCNIKQSKSCYIPYCLLQIRVDCIEKLRNVLWIYAKIILHYFL